MSGEQQDEQLGLAQWLDGFLFRLETSELNNRWFDAKQSMLDRRRLAAVFVALAITALAAGWLFGIAAGPDTPVESKIPLAAGDGVDASSAPASDRWAEGVGSGAGGESVQVDGGALPGGDGSGGTGDGTPEMTAGDPTLSDAGETPLVIHVAGAVADPGLVTVSAGARVNDAVMAAGGATSTADLDRLNLAAPVEDGMQILVPDTDDEETGPYLIRPDPPQEPSRSSPSTADTTGPISLNDASVDLLDTLPGVGPATAAAIVRWREENGGFHSLDDLLAVPGIGPAKMATIGDLVVL